MENVRRPTSRMEPCMLGYYTVHEPGIRRADIGACGVPGRLQGEGCSLLMMTTRSSPIAEGPRDASCQMKSCQLPRNSAETTCTTSPEPSISCR